MTAQKKIISNTFINILSTAIAFVSAYVMTPIILNRMGSETYGIWIFINIFSATGYFSLLDFGLQGAAIKYIAEYKSKNDIERLQSIVSATISFFLAAGVLAAIILLVFNSFFLSHLFEIPANQAGKVSFLIDIIAITFLFQFPAIAFSAFLEGLQRYDYLKGVAIAAMIISNIFIYLFLRFDNSVLFMVIVSSATSFGMMICYALLAKKILPEIRLTAFKAKKDTFGMLFNLSTKLFISKIIGLIFNNTDKILIGIFLTFSFQTQYDIVNKLHLILLSILSMFNQAILPATSEFFARNNHDTLKKLLLKSTKYVSVATLPSFIFIMFFAPKILSIWINPSFASLAPLVRLYCSHIIITMLVGISSTMLVGMDKVGQVLKISVLAAALNLFISIVTISKLGIFGLILGTAVSYIISSVIYIFATNRIFAITNTEFFLRVIAPVIPASAGVVCFFLGISYFVSPGTFPQLLILSMSGYMVFVCIFYLSGLDKEEKNMVKAGIAELKTKLLIKSS